MSGDARALGIVLSPSLIAIAPESREALARVRASSGEWVHADIIEGRYRGQPGIGWEELARLARIPGVRLDVHLMVDDLAEALARVPRGVSRITIQADFHPAAFRWVAAARHRAEEVWMAWDGGGELSIDPDWVRLTDGVLMMLTPPGRAGYAAELQRISGYPLRADHGEGGGVRGVDGGVLPAHFGALAGHGVRYVVMGRAYADLGSEPR
ncbi:hypothetical protein [Mycetocola tolaasinivorans]|uniref:hypothetical protein n=1 Tax=Mycetocola tolaasinivorans TaxID=76635 RepID=UPI0015FFC42D|nr:hypothetical protein [Mycetocola tolaasinivorans]